MYLTSQAETPAHIGPDKLFMWQENTRQVHWEAMVMGWMDAVAAICTGQTILEKLLPPGVTSMSRAGPNIWVPNGTHISTEDDRQTGAQGNGQDLEKRFVSNHWIDSFTTQKVWQIADIKTKSQCTRGYMQYFVCHHEHKVVAPPEGTSSIVRPNLTFPFTTDSLWSCLAWRQLPVLGTDSGPLLCSWPDLCYTKTPLQELAAGCLAKDSQAPASVCKKTQERPTWSPFPKHFGAVNSARKIKWQATGHRFLMVLHHKQLQDRRQMQSCWCVYFSQLRAKVAILIPGFALSAPWCFKTCHERPVR